MVPNRLCGLKSLKLMSCVPPSASKASLGKKFAREAPISFARRGGKSFALRDVRSAAEDARAGLGERSRVEEGEILLKEVTALQIIQPATCLPRSPLGPQTVRRHGQPRRPRANLGDY